MRLSTTISPDTVESDDPRPTCEMLVDADGNLCGRQAHVLLILCSTRLLNACRPCYAERLGHTSSMYCKARQQWESPLAHFTVLRWL